MPTRLEGDRVLVNNRWVHGDGSNLGFLRTDGNWDMYVSNGGNMWTAQYGWLHDHFFRVTANCASSMNGNGDNAINCYGSGSLVANRIHELIDEGGQIRLRTVRLYTNCACDCK